MIAVALKRSTPGCLDLREGMHAVATSATAPGAGDPKRGSLANRTVARMLGRIGELLERRRQAERARRNRPLSLDDAWAGGWYAQSRMSAHALLQRSGPKGAPPPQQDWDDKLD